MANKRLELLYLSYLLRFILTVIVGLICGLIANDKLKLPAGGIIGSLLGVAVFNVLSAGIAFTPWYLRIITQSFAGGYLGIKIGKKDLAEFKYLLVPILIMLGGLMVLNIGAGFLISSVSNMDLVTAMLATTPGGVTEISLLAPQMGANQSQVAIMHLTRLIFVICTFPTMLKYLAARFDPRANLIQTEAPDLSSAVSRPVRTTKDMLITIAIALVSGVCGYISKMPSGTLAFSTLAVALYNIKSDKAFLPLSKRKYVQVGAGLIIGSGVGMTDVLGIGSVIVPAVIMMVGYILTNIFLSLIIRRFTKVDLTTALFATSPGGVSDMAIIAMDLGGDAPKIATMQMARLFSAISLFPLMTKFVVMLFGG